MKISPVTMIGLIIILGISGYGRCDLPTPHPNAVQEIGQEKIIAYPIPAATVVHFAFQASSDQTVVIKIVNARFKLVKQLEGLGSSGYGQISWDVADIAPGLYFYLTTIGDEMQPVKRLVISR